MQADATRLPLAAGSVDLVVTRGVLHHLPDVVAALADWRRVLRPGGAVVVASEPTPTVRAARRGAGPRPAAAAAPAADPDRGLLGAGLDGRQPARLHARTGWPRRPGEAGYTDVRLDTADLLSTLVLTGSYVVHGRRRALARRIPWRALEAAARAVDGTVVDRLVPARLRHTVVGVLRP